LRIGIIMHPHTITNTIVSLYFEELTESPDD
jgi:hypothetical protein